MANPQVIPCHKYSVYDKDSCKFIESTCVSMDEMTLEQLVESRKHITQIFKMKFGRNIQTFFSTTTVDENGLELG